MLLYLNWNIHVITLSCDIITCLIYKNVVNCRSGGGVLSTKDPTGTCANMGSKISLLVSEWPFKNAKKLICEWVNFSKFSQIWAKIGLNLRKFCDFVQNFVQKWVDCYMNGSLFLKYWCLCRSTSISMAAHPYQNQTWVPPGFTLDKIHLMSHKTATKITQFYQFKWYIIYQIRVSWPFSMVKPPSFPGGFAPWTPPAP